MQLSEAQAQELLTVRRTLMSELGGLIAQWDQLWAQLQVHSFFPASSITYEEPFWGI